MADKKITALTDLGTGLASVDLFHVVDDPIGTPINKKISALNVFNNIPTWLGLKSVQSQLTADISSVGVIDVTSAITPIVATSVGGSFTLANGTAEGQIKTIINISASGTNIVTITPQISPGVGNLRGYTTITLNAPGETVTLLYQNSKWNIIGGNGYATA